MIQVSPSAPIGCSCASASLPHCSYLPCHLPFSAELLYPSGLLRKPLRCAVKRAVVNSPAWRPGSYLVLDTGKQRGSSAARRHTEDSRQPAGSSKGASSLTLLWTDPLPLPLPCFCPAVRGMLRLEPGSAEEHARWVLALNAAFLASGGSGSGGASAAGKGDDSSRAAAAGGSGGGDTLLADQRWSPAILFG